MSHEIGQKPEAFSSAQAQDCPNISKNTNIIIYHLISKIRIPTSRDTWEACASAADTFCPRKRTTSRVKTMSRRAPMPSCSPTKREAHLHCLHDMSWLFSDRSFASYSSIFFLLLIPQLNAMHQHAIFEPFSKHTDLHQWFSSARLGYSPRDCIKGLHHACANTTANPLFIATIPGCLRIWYLRIPWFQWCLSPISPLKQPLREKSCSFRPITHVRNGLSPLGSRLPSSLQGDETRSFVG